MRDYIINDKWILDRVSTQSISFNDWFNDLINIASNAVKDIKPEALIELKKHKSIPSLKDMDRDLANAKKELEKAQKELTGLGSLGKLVSGIGDNLSKQIISSVQQDLKKELKFDLNLDVLTGKRKTLSSALYDVSKERGIDLEGILYLIQALPDLEAFLYSTSVKKYYRDHTEHALRVAVLGDFLLEQDLGQGELVGVMSELIELDKNLIKDKFWWITGLIHDIGYPLGKMTTAVNYSLINQLLKCYPTLDLEFIPIEIGLSWKGNQERYLEIIEEGLSKEARELIRRGSGFNNQNIVSQGPQIYLKTESEHPEYAYSQMVDLDHGVISALSLLKGLGTPEEIRHNDEYTGYILVAKAIALHNFKAQLKEYVFDNHPLAFFLMLIDELQEWGRPVPIQIRDSYFTTELKKVTLMDDISLNLDDFSWLLQFKSPKAKELMKFNFSVFSEEKKKTFGRLNRGNKFSETKIHLQDVKLGKKEKKKESIVNETTIII